MNDSTPRFARDHRHGQRPSRRWPRWALLLALLLSLGVLSVLGERERLASDSRWRPALARMCAIAGCTLPPWREPARFAVVAREVRPHPERQGALQLVLSFRNDAAWAQAWPRLEVGFADVDGNPQALRVFAPAEYLGGEPAFAEIAPGQSVHVSLELVDPGKSALAFHIEFH
ncbi:MAG TPA: DUF3426 domain-containing protein [Arenimonas sp.]|nr:DUF3426 domain-containing protein [Arenimonas sp.]